ncbi:MAG: hypothetical protein V6Z78_03980 [Holosporaceae bacterium]
MMAIDLTFCGKALGAAGLWLACLAGVPFGGVALPADKADAALYKPLASAAKAKEALFTKHQANIVSKKGFHTLAHPFQDELAIDFAPLLTSSQRLQAENLIAIFEASFLPQTHAECGTFNENFVEDDGFFALTRLAGTGVASSLSCLCFVRRCVDNSADNVYVGMGFKKMMGDGAPQNVVRYLQFKSTASVTPGLVAALFEAQTPWTVT